jgi:arylsulfatase A-like enzyme
MKQKFFLLTIFLVATLIACNSKNNISKKTNVIFILADDLGWKDLACYGSDFYETPNLDAFAKTGVLFTDAYTASPLCSPTRASILTGMEPGRLRLTTAMGHAPFVVLDPKESTKAEPHFKVAESETCTRLSNDYLTFAEVLKENGYSTAFMGKWHLGHEPYVPENQGFDLVVGGRAHPGPPGPGHFFSPWNCETLPVVPEGTHIADVLTDEAVKYLKANKENPFLLCLWYYDVHAPFQAKEELKKKYQAKLNSNHIQRSPTMGGMIEIMDTNIGRVLKTVEDLQLEDETIVIFTSDNGGNMYDGPDCTTPTNNYPLRAGKGNNYEGGVRVPLIVRVPGVTKAGKKSAVVTSTVDHYKSLLELLGIPFPDNIVTDGVSYVDALKGKKYEREPIYSAFGYYMPATGNRPNISMRQGPWRLYKFYYDGPNREHRYELYNLKKDIGETKNLADELPERVEAMTRLIDAHEKEADMLLPQKNENYTGNVADAWQGSSDTKIRVENKVLNIKSTGSNPYIETHFTSRSGNCTFYLKFEMKSNSTGNGSIAWKEVRESTYLPEKLTDFKSIHDGNWHQYKVEMPMKRALKVLKIQPSSGEGMIELRNIELVSTDDHYIRDWPLY